MGQTLATQKNKEQDLSLSVLFVDDNTDASAVMVELVSAMGHKAESATDGRTALRVARRVRPEVIFVDLGLPDIDGCELARQLRQDPATANARIFVLTGSGREEDRARSLAVGCDGYHVKPLDARFLESLLRAR
jgi:CheY-like chemotaxis protein